MQSIFGIYTYEKSNITSSNGSYHLLSISCMEGKEKRFIARFNPPVGRMHPLSQGYWVVIGLPNKGLWSEQKWKNDLSKSVLRCMGNGASTLWAKDGTFVGLYKLNKSSNQSFYIRLEEANYQNLLSQGYNMYILSFDPKMPNGQVDYSGPIKLEGGCQPLPDYTSIGLRAEHAIREELAGQARWRFQGSVEAGYDMQYASDIQVGFLLVKVKEDFNTWDLVQKRIASGLDDSVNLLDDVMMLPGSLSKTDCFITSDFPIKHLPPTGCFKLFAYLMQGNHYYISQMQHVCSNPIKKATKEQTPPPIITFEDYSLRLPNLRIILHKSGFSGGINDVTLAGLDIKYLINGEPTKWPAGLKACLLLSEKQSGQVSLSALDFNTIASLFREWKLAENSGVTKDGKFCLITNKAQKLDRLSLSFFGAQKSYTFFICGFSERDKSFQYYTAIDDLSVDITESQKGTAGAQGDSGSSWLTSSSSSTPSQKASGTVPIVNGKPSSPNRESSNKTSVNIETLPDATLAPKPSFNLVGVNDAAISSKDAQTVVFNATLTADSGNQTLEKDYQDASSCTLKTDMSNPKYNTWTKMAIKITPSKEYTLDKRLLHLQLQNKLEEFFKNQGRDVGRTIYAPFEFAYYADINNNDIPDTKDCVPKINTPRLYHCLWDDHTLDDFTLCEGH